jgi:ribosome-binding protein aMBF1 (putative translation factor)
MSYTSSSLGNSYPTERLMSRLSDVFAAERARRGESAESAPRQDRFSFASTVIAVRRAAGLSQRELADKTGVPQSEISRIERGLTVPTITRAQALLTPLGWRLGVVSASQAQDEVEDRELVHA